MLIAALYEMKMKMEITMKSFLSLLCIVCYCYSVSGKKGESKKETSDDLNFYSFPVMDIHDNIVSLDKYIGKVSLVVNVASQCGYTDSHYSSLRVLQEMFEETEAFTVLAFPCNQFGEQEPGSHKQIFDFAYKRMGANFPLFAKVNVIQHDIPAAWSYLIEASHQEPTWNFWKYLVDHNGELIDAWGPSTNPDQLYLEIKTAVEKAVEARKDKGKDQKSDKSNQRRKDEF